MRRLFVKGFKSINQMDIQCKRVNIFIGPPNTGKSNILESIGAISAVGHFDRGGFSRFVRMQSMTDLFYRKSPSNPIQIGFDVNQQGVLSDAGLNISREGEMYKVTLELGNPRSSTVQQVDANGNPRPMRSQFWQVRAFNFYRFSEQTNYGPSPVECLEPPDGHNLLAVLLANDQLQEIVAEMCANVGMKLILKEAESSIELQREYQRNVAVSFPLRFTSESLQRTIFTYAAIYSNKDSVITLEEPEAHAFPYHTKALAETIGLDKRGNQYFIATHNPYLLTSVIEKTPKDQIVVAITSFAGTDTEVTSLTDNQLGELFEAGADAFFNLESLVKK